MEDDTDIGNGILPVRVHIHDSSSGNIQIYAKYTSSVHIEYSWGCITVYQNYILTMTSFQQILASGVPH